MLAVVAVVDTLVSQEEQVEMVAVVLAAVVQLVLTAQQIVVVAVVELVLLLQMFQVVLVVQVLPSFVILGRKKALVAQLLPLVDTPITHSPALAHL
jgi:hypothetical protein